MGETSASAAALGRPGVAAANQGTIRLRAGAALAPDEAVIDLIYDAAADPLLWDDALTRLADRLGSTSCVLVGHQAGSWNAPRFGHFGRLDPEINLRGSREDFGESPFMPKLTTLGVGEVAASDDIMPLGEARRTAWYGEIMTPQDIGHCLMAPVIRGYGLFGAFFLARSERKGAFSPREAESLGRYMPHLSRAIALRCRFEAFGALARNQRDALDAIEIGIILIDEAGIARCANRAAQEIAAAGKGLKLSGPLISVADREGGARLNALIADAAAGGAGGTLALRQSEFEGPLVAFVCPLRGAIREKLSRPWETRQSVALFIKDPARGCLAATEQAMASFYGLTPGEARVAAFLAAGVGINGAAQRLTLSENTVKMHAKRVFEKTGVNSQVELARFYGRLAAPVRVSEPVADAA